MCVTQGQLVGSGEKAGQTFSSTDKRVPRYRLSPNYFQKSKQMPASDWAQKMLCIIVPTQRTVSPEFFSGVRTRRLLSWSRLVWLTHQRNARSQEAFTLTENPHLISKYCVPENLKRRLSKNTSLSFQQVFTLTSVTSCVNIREFLKVATTADSHENVAWKSEFTFFQSLSWLFQLAYVVKYKRTLLELNFYQPYSRSWGEWILSLLVYVLHKTWN